MPRVGDAVDESEWRVSKLSSFFRMTPRRSSDTAPTSATIRGSRSPSRAVTGVVTPVTVERTARTMRRTGFMWVSMTFLYRLRHGPTAVDLRTVDDHDRY